MNVFWPRLLDNESREGINRIAILLYLLVTPVFNVTLALLAGPAGFGFVAVTTALCLAGLVWLVAAPGHWWGRWVLPVSIVPVACCGLGALAAGPSGLVYLTALTAPLAWSAILFDMGTTVATYVTTLATFAAVITLKVGPAAALWGTLVLGVIEFLVGWVVFAKGSTLRLAQRESLERQLNDIEITLDTKGRIIFANAVAEQAYGWSQEEFLSRTIADLRLAGDAAALNEQFETVVHQGQVRFDTVHRRKDGTTFPVAVNSRAFATRGQTFLHSLIRDITAERAAREDLDRLNARLSRENADKGRLLALLGHDLGNNLGAFTRLLKLSEGSKGMSQEEFFAKVLPLLKESAEGCRAMLQNILAWMRSTTEFAGQARDFHAREVVAAAVAAVQASADAKGIRLDQDGVATLACRGNPGAVIAILRNLLDNAVKYSSPEGVVTLTAAVQQGRTVFAVTDRGLGIPAERLARLFELEEQHSTTGTAGEHGNGLGLWLCREIAANLSGSLSVESTHGEGSVFRLTL